MNRYLMTEFSYNIGIIPIFDRQPLEMQRNLGNIDRIARWSISGVVLLLYFLGVLYGPIGIVLLVLAGIFLITGSLGFCPIYVLFRINNYEGRPRKKKKDSKAVSKP